MAHGTRRAEANTSLVMSKSVGMDLQKDLMGQIWDVFLRPRPVQIPWSHANTFERYRILGCCFLRVP
jgi:hypothetical protein